jgi:hypothetical protein
MSASLPRSLDISEARNNVQRFIALFDEALHDVTFLQYSPPIFRAGFSRDLAIGVSVCQGRDTIRDKECGAPLHYFEEFSVTE